MAEFLRWKLKTTKRNKEKERIMRKLRKVMALLLTLAMVMGMSLTTFAANSIIGDSDDTGTIAVKGITETEGLTVTAYKIIEAKYDETTEAFSGYRSRYDDVTTDDINTTPDGENVEINEEQVKEILADIQAENPSVTPDPYTMSYDSNTGSYKASGVGIGSYLVVITGAETHVYNPVVASVYYTNDTGSANDISDGITNITSNPGWVKVSDVPTVSKVVSDNDETNVKGHSVNVGETVTYDVTVSPIPYYSGAHPTLKVTDTLEQGLTFVENVEDSLTVKIGQTPLVKNTDYTVNVDGQTIVINFVVGGNYTLNNYQGQSAVISYQATVNTNAEMNELANENKVVLDYAKDSKVAGAVGQDTDKTYTYTFDIDGDTTGNIITKKGEGGDSEALAGAKFKLYTDADCQNEYQSNPKFNASLEEGYIVSDQNGQLYIPGLEANYKDNAAGTYYLKEIEAPDGYSVNTHIFKIEVDANYNEEMGIIKGWTITVDGTAVASFTVEDGELSNTSITGVTIQNTKLAELPGTGGIGTTIFTIGGCVIMIAAAGLYFASRRKHGEN